MAQFIYFHTPESSLATYFSLSLAPAFPFDPVLENPGPVLLGEEAVFRCDVINVFWANQLRIQWLLGNKTVAEKSFSFSSVLQNVSFSLHHRVDEDHQVLTCIADLLQEGGDLWRSKRTSIHLQVHCKCLLLCFFCSSHFFQIQLY